MLCYIIMMLHHITLHCIILYYIILYYIILYYIILYCILLYYIIFYYILLYSIIFHYILLYSIIFYYILLYNICMCNLGFLGSPLFFCFPPDRNWSFELLTASPHRKHLEIWNILSHISMQFLCFFFFFKCNFMQLRQIGVFAFRMNGMFERCCCFDIRLNYRWFECKRSVYAHPLTAPFIFTVCWTHTVNPWTQTNPIVAGLRLLLLANIIGCNVQSWANRIDGMKHPRTSWNSLSKCRRSFHVLELP